MKFAFILLAVSLSFGIAPLEYKLLKKFMETKDEGIALFLLSNYPEAVFADELRIELAHLLVRKGEPQRAKKVLKGVNLKNVRDMYGETVASLWDRLDLDPKPLVLRFPELSPELIERVDLSPEETQAVFDRLLSKRKYREVLRYSEDCFFRGVALFRLRRYEESIKELKDCDNERADRYVLRSYLRLGNVEEARRFVKSKGKDELYFMLGRVMLSSGEYDKARMYFLYSGESFDSYFYAGIADFLRGKFLLSYENFSRAQHLAKGNLEKGTAYFWKFKVLKKLGFTGLANYYLKLASETSGFYSAVARRILGKRVSAEVNFAYPADRAELADRLIKIKDLGFPYYMRLEALSRLEDFTPADVLKLRDTDPFIAIKVAVRVFGANSDVYKAVAFPTPFKNIVLKYSREFSVDPPLIYAVMRQESLFDRWALSTSEAKGLMQLIDTTAEWMAKRLKIKLKDVYEPETNILLGVAYLRFLLDLWDGDLVKAIASYNAGQGAVSRWKDPGDDFLFIETIPFGETRKYVKRVLWFYYVYSEKLLR